MRRSVSSGERISKQARGGFVSICSTGSSSETTQISGTRNLCGEMRIRCGEDFNVPFILAPAKPEDQSCLYRRMVMFTHIPFLNPAIHKVAIRAVAAAQVLSHRN